MASESLLASRSSTAAKLLTPKPPSKLKPTSGYRRQQANLQAGRLMAASKALGHLRSGILSEQFDEMQVQSMLSHQVDKRVMALWSKMAAPENPMRICAAARERGYCSLNREDEETARQIVSRHWQMKLPSGVHALCQGVAVSFEVPKAARLASVALLKLSGSNTKKGIIARRNFAGMSGKEKNFVVSPEGALSDLFVDDSFCPAPKGSKKQNPCDMLRMFMPTTEPFPDQKSLAVSDLPPIELLSYAVSLTTVGHEIAVDVTFKQEMEFVFSYETGLELGVKFEDAWRYVTIKKVPDQPTTNLYTVFVSDEVLSRVRTETIRLTLSNHFVLDEAGFGEELEKQESTKVQSVREYVLNQRIWHLLHLKVKKARTYVGLDGVEKNGTQSFLEECKALFEGAAPEAIVNEETGEESVTREVLEQFMRQQHEVVFSDSLQTMLRDIYGDRRTTRYVQSFDDTISGLAREIEHYNAEANPQMSSQQKTAFRVEDRYMTDEEQCRVTQGRHWRELVHEEIGVVAIDSGTFQTRPRIDGRRKQSWFTCDVLDNYFAVDSKHTSLEGWKIKLILPEDAIVELAEAPSINRLTDDFQLESDAVFLCRPVPAFNEYSDLDFVSVKGKDLRMNLMAMQSARVDLTWKSVMCCCNHQRVTLPTEDGSCTTAVIVGNMGTSYLYRSEKNDTELTSKWKIPKIKVLKQVVLPARSLHYPAGQEICLKSTRTRCWSDCVVVQVVDELLNKYEVEALCSGGGGGEGVDAGTFEICLNEGNHFPLLAPQVKLEKNYKQLLAQLRENSSYVSDVLTLNKTDVTHIKIRLEMASLFKPGDRVKLIELRNNRHLNGRECILLSWDTTRWHVQFADSPDECGEFKEKHLLRLSDGRVGSSAMLTSVDDLVFHGMPPAEMDAYERAALNGNVSWAQYLRLPQQKVITSVRQVVSRQSNPQGILYMYEPTRFACLPLPDSQKPVLVYASGSGQRVGKTWMAAQFVVNMCDRLLGPDCFMVMNNAFRIPFLLPVQKTAKAMKARLQKLADHKKDEVREKQQQKDEEEWGRVPPDAGVGTGTGGVGAESELGVDWLVRTKARDFPKVRRRDFVQVMRRAFATRKVVVFFDGIDEAGDLLEPLMKLITNVLLPGGHQIICTSKRVPKGHEKDFETWHKVSLREITHHERMAPLKSQIKSAFITEALDFVAQRQRLDALYEINFPEASLMEDLFCPTATDSADRKQYEYEGGELVATQRSLYRTAATAQKPFMHALADVVDRVGLDSDSDEFLSSFGIEGMMNGRSPQKPFLRVAQQACAGTDDTLSLPTDESEESEDVTDEEKGNKEKRERDATEWLVNGEPLTLDTVMPGLSIVTDVLRARICCQTARQMVDVVTATEYHPKLEIVELQNGFREMDSTHYRCLRLKVRVSGFAVDVDTGTAGTAGAAGADAGMAGVHFGSTLSCGGTHVGTVEVHHEELLRAMPDPHSHTLFRSCVAPAPPPPPSSSSSLSLASGGGEEAETLRMDLFARIADSPVLLSLLIVAMEREDAAAAPPTSLTALYELAVRAILAKKARTAASTVTVLRGDHQGEAAILTWPESQLLSGVKYKVWLGEDDAQASCILGEDLNLDEQAEMANGWASLKQVAAYAHLCLRRRKFGKEDVKVALAEKKQLREYWFNLAKHCGEDSSNVPCFKTIDTDSAHAAYQAQEISIQEFLAASFFFDFVCSKQNATIRKAHSLSVPDMAHSYQNFVPGAKYDIFRWFGSNHTQAKALNDKWNRNFFALLKDFKNSTEFLFPDGAIHLSGSKPSISIDGLTALSHFFPKTRELHLCKSQLDFEKISVLSRLLARDCSALTTLVLADNCCGCKSAAAIAAFLRKGKSALEILSLANNRLCRNEEAGEEAAEDAGAAGAASPAAVAQDYSGIAVLSAAFRASKTLASVDLSGNELRAEGAKFVAEAMARNKQIETLLLANNSIGVEGMSHIAQTLTRNHVIKTLDLAKNQVTGNDPYNPDFSGLNLLCGSLEQNECLTALNLSSNGLCGVVCDKSDGYQVGDYEGSGMIALAEALKLNSTLEKLNLADNNIGLQGLRLIVEMFKLNTTLSTLDLSSNGIGPQGNAYIAEMTKLKSKSLKKVFVQHGSPSILLSNDF